MTVLIRLISICYFIFVAFVGSLLSACEPASDNLDTHPLAAVEEATMSADYRGDLAELDRLHEAALSYADDPELGYLAHYWAGYASWRAAINGAVMDTPAAKLREHLESAAAQLDRSIQKRADFADGYAAAAMVRSWLAGFHDDETVIRELLIRSREQLEMARSLAPENPRVLWAEGAELMFTPPEYGGSAERAIEKYRQMLAAAGAEEPTASPYPDWGKPEALMSLAYALLNQATPDLDLAAENARKALRLQPDWHYVRDVLLPQIEEQQEQSGS